MTLTEGERVTTDNLHKDIEYARGGSCPDVEVRGTNMFNEGNAAIEKQPGGNHYRRMALQPFEFIRANNIPHAEGEVIYHTLRHASKGGRQDIEKAIHWLQLILEAEYSEDRGD